MSTPPDNPPPPNGLNPTTPDGRLYVLRKNHLSLDQLEYHGVHNGLMQMDPEAMTSFVEANENKNRLADYVDYLRERQAEVRQQIEALEGRHKLRIESRHQIAHWEETDSRLRAQLRQRRDAHERQREAAGQINPEYGWISTFLFILAGLVFMATDFSITKNIAVEALNMADGEDGIAEWLPLGEATIFALGLAFLAFVFKPLVDRIFEKPYQAQHRKRMHVFLVCISILAVFNLASMGAYRKSAFVAREKIEQFRNEKKELESDLVIDPQNQEIKNRIETLNGNIEDQLEILDSGWVTVLFVLSSILFALAGALCFSLGFPAARQHWNRQATLAAAARLGWSAALLQRRIDRTVLRTLTQHRTAHDLAENMPPPLDSLDQLKALLGSLRYQEQKTLDKIHEHFISAQQAWYRNGYAFGQQFYPSHDMGIVFTMSQVGNPGNTTTSTFVRRGPATNGDNFFNNKYLYQRVREALNKQFSSQGKNTTDDSAKAKQNGQHVNNPGN